MKIKLAFYAKVRFSSTEGFIMKIVKKSAFAFVLSLSAGLCASDNKTKAAAGASANTGLNAGLLVAGTAAEHHYGDGSAAAGATSGGVAQRSSLWGDRRAGLGASTMRRADDVVTQTILFESRGAQLSPASDMQERVSTVLRKAIADLEANPTRWEAIRLDLEKSLVAEGRDLTGVCFGISPIVGEENQCTYGMGCLMALDAAGSTIFSDVNNPNVVKVCEVYKTYLKHLMQLFVGAYGHCLSSGQEGTGQEGTLNEIACRVGISPLHAQRLPEVQEDSRDEVLAKFGSGETYANVVAFLSSLSKDLDGMRGGGSLFASALSTDRYFYENFVNPIKVYLSRLACLLQDDDSLDGEKETKKEEVRAAYLKTFSYIAYAFKAACEVFGDDREDDRVNSLRDCFEFELRDLIMYFGRCCIIPNEGVRELDAECIELLRVLTHDLTLNGRSLEAIFGEEFADKRVSGDKVQEHVLDVAYAVDKMELAIKERKLTEAFLGPDQLEDFCREAEGIMRLIKQRLVDLQKAVLTNTDIGSLGASASGRSSAGATSGRKAPLPLRKPRQSVEGASGVDHRTEAGDVPGVDHRNRSLLGVSLGSNWSSAAVAAGEDSDEDSADAAAGEGFGKNSRNNRGGISKSFAPSHERK